MGHDSNFWVNLCDCSFYLGLKDLEPRLLVSSNF